MTDKTDFINSMVNVFEQYGDEYTIEQAMEHVADYCQKKFVEQVCEAIRSQIVTDHPAMDVNEWNLALEAAEQAIRDKFK